MIENATFVVNDYGITIEKKCVSCQHCENCGTQKVKEDTPTHKCTKHDKGTKANGRCEDWELKKGLYNAGKGGGKIKRRSYVEYLSALRVAEGSRDAEQTPVGEIRRQYKHQYNADVYL